jgi:hypothetical protein
MVTAIFYWYLFSGREEFVAQMGTAFNQNGNEHSWTFIEEENDVR